MDLLHESFDAFGLPITEARYRQSDAEDARNSLERSKDELRRALDRFRSLQPDFNANERVSSEIKSAISALINVEKELITATQRAENVVHRVRKLATQTESVRPLKESSEIEVDFDHPELGPLVAMFEVDGHLYRDDDYRLDFADNPEVKLLGIYRGEDTDPVQVELSPNQLEELEETAIEFYKEEWKEHVEG